MNFIPTEHKTHMRSLFFILLFFIICTVEDIKRAYLLAYGQCIHSLLVEMTLPALSWFLIPSKDSFKNSVVATESNTYF